MNLPILDYHEKLLKTALDKLRTYKSIIATLPPGVAAEKVISKSRTEYVEAITDVIKHVHELESGCNVIATYPVNANENLLQ